MIANRCKSIAAWAIVLAIAPFTSIGIYYWLPAIDLQIADGSSGRFWILVISASLALLFSGIVVAEVRRQQKLSETSEVLRVQRFERQFYRLLERYREDLAGIAIKVDGVLHTGSDAFGQACRRLNLQVREYASLFELKEQRPLDDVRHLEEVQKILRGQPRYLVTLKALLELIDRELVDGGERKFYWNVVAGEIRSVEARYLFFCCLVSAETDGLRPLMHFLDMSRFRVRSSLHATQLEREHEAHRDDLIDVPTTLVVSGSRSEVRSSAVDAGGR